MILIVNKRREILYLQAAMYYSVYYINLLITTLAILIIVNLFFMKGVNQLFGLAGEDCCCSSQGRTV